MKKVFVLFFIVAPMISSLSAAHGKVESSTTTPEMIMYSECKKQALERRKQLISNSQRIYVEESEKVTNETKVGLEIVKWRVLSSFRADSKKILDDQGAKLTTLAKKTSGIKVSAENTWKAEDSLCTLQYEKIKQLHVAKPKKNS